QVTSDPKSFKFTVRQIDGWYESDVELEAWITRNADGEIYALSPVSKHLGCTVDWNSNPQYANQFYCPCHGAHYTKEGKTLAVSPLPLDEYKIKLENGSVYLGKVQSNQRVK